MTMRSMREAFVYSAVKSLEAKRFAYLTIGCLLLFFCAQVQIPLRPVPITLQTFALVVIGLRFPKKEALRSVAAYLFLGAMGVPVFAGYYGGIARLSGATGGFLFGFLASAWVMTTLREKLKFGDFKNTLIVACLGQATTHFFGIAWLSATMGVKQALIAGLYPFILPGVVKSFLIAGSVKLIGKR